MSNTNTRCPRCRSKFHIISPEPYVNCPFCGFPFRVTEPRREQERISTQRDCYLLKGDEKIFVKTMDVSKDGVGVKTTGPMPFERDDAVQVIVKDLKMDSTANVVWVKRFDSAISRAGLKFC
jgi:DNA-directed RNA polymerase subunit RPC12/RpoP